nr:hypothetical protein [Piscinibacter sp.]
LVVTVLLLFVMALAVGLAHRNLIFEQRSSANQLRSTRAFEAAEAGLAWAQALLDRGGAIGAACSAADAAPGDTSFRDRYLAFDAASGTFVPRGLPGTGAALQAACVAADDDGGWACSCPADSAPALDAPDGSTARPAFFVRFEPATRAGMVQLVATGCDHLGPACDPAAGAPFGAAGAELRATLAVLPALATLPGAALSARGGIDVDAALTLANQEGAGVTARAGGAIVLPAATLVTVPGHDAAASLAALDPALAGIDAERLLTRLLGADRGRWRRLPGVRTVDCSVDCAGTLATATAPEAGVSMLWITTDLALDGPLVLGTPERPLLLVVEGQARLNGGVTLHGVLVSLAATWDTTASADAEVRGAVIALGDVRGDGTPTIVRDAAVLARLHGGAVGHFVRVAGSWRDF